MIQSKTPFASSATSRATKPAIFSAAHASIASLRPQHVSDATGHGDLADATTEG